MSLQPIAQSISTVDVIFPLAGGFLPRDHAQALQDALCAHWPWLATEPHAAIHAIKLVPGLDSLAMLSRRARLLVRVPDHRSPEMLATTGMDVQVGGHALRLEAPHQRELQPHATLYAYTVAAPNEDESSFLAEVTRELASLGIGGERVCGKRQKIMAQGGLIHAFSLMLHALPAEQSLRLQHHGIGAHRLLGCGIFLPHKSAAAV